MLTSNYVELSSFNTVFSFNEDVFKHSILPILSVYSIHNEELRLHVHDLLTKACKFYPTPQNVEIFTDVCLSLGIKQEGLIPLNFENVRKEIIKNLTNRDEFNILDIIQDVFNCKVNKNNSQEHAWFADAPQSRGHDKIGSGEIFFSFFCGGIKPEKGDVSIGQVIPLKFELKGYRGRLLETEKILVSDNYKSELLSRDLTLDDILNAVFVITGTLTSEEGKDVLLGRGKGNETYLKYKSDVYNALVATNCFNEIDILRKALTKRWPANVKSAIRAICGALQLTIYKQNLNFDYIILTDNDKPFMCKGFSVVDNVLANTLTLLHNDVNIQQSLDGKGYQISFDY
jgi:hypothetical protein